MRGLWLMQVQTVFEDKEEYAQRAENAVTKTVMQSEHLESKEKV